MKDYLQTLADNLLWHMKARGLTETELARLSGVSPRTVGNFLRPVNRRTKRGVVRAATPSGTLESLYKLAVALEVEPWELLCEYTAAQLSFCQAVEQAYRQRLRVEQQQQSKEEES